MTIQDSVEGEDAAIVLYHCRRCKTKCYFASRWDKVLKHKSRPPAFIECRRCGVGRADPYEAVVIPHDKADAIMHLLVEGDDHALDGYPTGPIEGIIFDRSIIQGETTVRQWWQQP